MSSPPETTSRPPLWALAAAVEMLNKSSIARGAARSYWSERDYRVTSVVVIAELLVKLSKYDPSIRPADPDEETAARMLNAAAGPSSFRTAQEWRSGSPVPFERVLEAVKAEKELRNGN